MIIGACTNDSRTANDSEAGPRAQASADQVLSDQASDDVNGEQADRQPPADADGPAATPDAADPPVDGIDDEPDLSSIYADPKSEGGGVEDDAAAVKGLSESQPDEENVAEADEIPEPPNPTVVSERVEATEFKITPRDAESNDEFAWSLDLDGDALVSGAPLADDNGGNSGIAYIFRWSGTAWEEEGKLVPEDGREGDWFGKSAGVSGDTAVVGANRDDGPMRGEFYDDDTGSAYVFVREDGPDGPIWVQQAKLRADPQIEFAEFGFDVEIEGDLIAVSAWHDPSVDFNTGAVYVFHREGTEWTQEAKLVPSQGRAADEFGFDIAISGDTILVGSSRDDGQANDAGAGYVYRRVAGRWFEEAILRVPDGQGFDQLGWSVALEDNTAVLGAPFHDGLTPDGGAAYVFEREGTMWTATWKLAPSDPFQGAWFGRAVGVAGHYALVGAPRYDQVTIDGIANEIFNLGVSYLFQRTTQGWLQVAQLRADDPSDGDDFGWTVVLSREIAVVGAWLDDTEAGVDTGSAYSYVLAQDLSDGG
jgi:hypothetical protein